MITKTTFLSSIYCPTKLYLNQKHPELKEVDANITTRLNTGTEVGLLARSLYYGGKDLSQSKENNHISSEERTKIALATDERIFYEPTFISPDGTLKFRADLVIKTNRKWKLIEVKSSTKIKPYQHLMDIGFQYKVLQLNGLHKKFDFYIAHLNKEYVLEDDLNLEELFVIEKVTTRARLIQPLVERVLYQANKTLKKNRHPKTEIGAHCMQPYKCEFFNQCWKNKTNYNVFQIGGLRKSVASSLYFKGIFEVEDIPRNIKGIKQEQWIEIDAEISGKPSINARAIKRFMTPIKNETLLFLDFETVRLKIPVFKGTHPNQQFCFQFCLLIQNFGSTKIVRKDFLAEPGFDPRRNFIERLLKDTNVPGKIIVYSNFEERMLKELAVLFPEYAEHIEERISRMVDLMKPFAERKYYHPDFKGSHSLKVVSKVLCPDIDYSLLEIQNGMMAMNAFMKMHKLSEVERLKMKRALLEYCFTDTLCMLEIINEFRNI